MIHQIFVCFVGSVFADLTNSVRYVLFIGGSKKTLDKIRKNGVFCKSHSRE